jgi:hypothetical protein
VQPVQHRSPGHTLRVQSTAAPYWDDDTKSRLNVYTDYTIYKVAERDKAPQHRIAALPASRPLLSASWAGLHLLCVRMQTTPQGKAAMAIKVIKPTWEAKSSGLAIQREGTVLLEFAPNVGTQTYDWSRKEVRPPMGSRCPRTCFKED